MQAAYGAVRRAGKALAAVALAAAITSLSSPGAAEDRPPLRIAILGDSLTQGYGLPAGEGLVDQAQAWLDARGAGVVLINAGVSGDTTAGGRSRIAWTLADRPDGVVISLGGNDFLRGLPPEETRANLAAIIEVVQAAGAAAALVALPAPANLGRDYKARFDAIFPELAARYEVPLLADLFAPIRGDGSASSILRHLQPDGIHPDAGGVRRIVEGGFGPFLEAFAARIAAQKEGGS